MEKENEKIIGETTAWESVSEKDVAAFLAEANRYSPVPHFKNREVKMLLALGPNTNSADLDRIIDEYGTALRSKKNVEKITEIKRTLFFFLMRAVTVGNIYYAEKLLDAGAPATIVYSKYYDKHRRFGKISLFCYESKSIFYLNLDLMAKNDPKMLELIVGADQDDVEEELKLIFNEKNTFGKQMGKTMGAKTAEECEESFKNISNGIIQKYEDARRIAKRAKINCDALDGALDKRNIRLLEKEGEMEQKIDELKTDIHNIEYDSRRGKISNETEKKLRDKRFELEKLELEHKNISKRRSLLKIKSSRKVKKKLKKIREELEYFRTVETEQKEKLTRTRLEIEKIKLEKLRGNKEENINQFVGANNDFSDVAGLNCPPPNSLANADPFADANGDVLAALRDSSEELLKK
ncbi:MAG: hypothetical protein LBB09_01375 [Rickettsiales bacterium]|jgi:hypothetical protein|nr:hypothetical protein [Rickettsiales bacterium]